MAVVAFCCSVGGLFLGGIPVIAGIVLGHVALREIDRSDGTLDGRGFALAAVIVGWVLVAIFVLLVVALVAAFAS